MRTNPPGRRRGLTRTLSVVAVTAVTSACLIGAGALPASAADGDVAIDILSINDFHGRIEASSSTAGAAVLAGAVDSYRAANPNTLFVSAGDSIGASTFTSFIQDDQPTLDVLNAMDLDVSTLGNHEFDKGRADLDGRVTSASDFPYVNANLYDTTTGEHAYAPYSISEVEGVKVAFIGAMTEDLPILVSPGGISTLSIEPGSIVADVNAVATELQDGDDANGEADVIVVLLHEGADANNVDNPVGDEKFGPLVEGIAPNVDAIVSGHSHQLYNSTFDAGRAFPTVISQTESYGTNLGHISVTVDPATKELTSLSSEVVPLLGSTFTPDPEVQAIVDAASAVAVEAGSVKVGEITDDIARAYREDGTTTNRGSESTLGNLVADAQLAATAELGTQIAFTNAGGLRDDLDYAADPATPGDADGVVTYSEAANAQPFANTLVTMTVTGAQITQLLEEQWVGSSSHPDLKLATSKGLSYVFDPSAEDGSHITAVFFDEKPIDPAAQYKIVTNSFLSTGGDGFSTFAEGVGTVDSGRIDLDAFVNFIAAAGTVGPDPVQRSIGLVENTPESGEYAVGDTIELALSSLLFSTGEQTDTTVTASVDGTVVASAEIDPTRAETDDSTGRATLSFEVPASWAGTTPTITVALDRTGTALTVLVPVAEQAVVPPTEEPTPTPEPTEPPATSTPGPIETIIPTTPSNPGAGSGAGSLASTGVDLTPAALAALFTMLLGAGLLVARRRREARAE